LAVTPAAVGRAMNAAADGAGRAGVETAPWLEHLAWTTLAIVSRAVYVELDRMFWNKNAYVGEKWVDCVPAYLFLYVPLALVLLFGGLLRRGLGARRARLPSPARAGVESRPSKLPYWMIAWATLSAGVAATIDILLVSLVDLARSSDEHWLLYPWLAMGLTLYILVICRAALLPRQAGNGDGAVDASEGLDRQWDWFGDAVIAAVFTGLLVIVMTAYMVAGLYRDFVVGHFEMTAMMLVPLGCMVLRRGVIAVLRMRRGR
jgi:hypothetical protein